ncbi:hypothetical protein ABK040_003783 [Willaertia magna]
MFHRMSQLTLDENTNPSLINNSIIDNPIKPISIHTTKPSIIKQNHNNLYHDKENQVNNNGTMRTALSSIMNKMKTGFKKQKELDEKINNKPQKQQITSTTTTTTTTNTNNNNNAMNNNNNNTIATNIIITNMSLPQQQDTFHCEEEQLTNNNNICTPPKKNNKLNGNAIVPTTIIEDDNTTTSTTTLINNNNNKNVLVSPGIDKGDTDPQSCVEYVKDIYQHYKSIETKYRADPDYISKQPYLKHKHRFMIVNWLVEVHKHFELSNATLFLTINLLDRFLSKQPVGLKYLQLVGATCLFISSKYEDLQYPTSGELVKISKNNFTKEEMLHVERMILKELDFNITVATIYPFLKRYLKCARCKFDQLATSYYLVELSLLEETCLNYLPSMIASACIYLAGKFCRRENCWDEVLQYYTGYTEQDIAECASVMFKIARKYSLTSDSIISREKYLHADKARVAYKVISHFEKVKKKESGI